MRLHKHDHLSSKLEEDTPTPKRRRKKQKSKLRIMKPPEATWGNATRHNGSPRDACGEEQPDSYSDAGYGGKGLAGCSSGSHTYNTSTPARGESNKVCAKAYSCPKCKNTFFPTPRRWEATLLIITESWRRRARQS
ncbi:unnamed protein product [Miscanthus lutarioriparius]|uniref:Uncharacterized protein n=1 Tax=Miscanthus lutarioriparius TaxID=422564 RepID=A0A811Q204_9POAL|nr:unnamed protein product [Miscanthus lutarioriparius]